MSDLACRIAALYVHPVKSCGGIAVDEALLIETGLEFDRAWMLVDANGAMLTQRDEPRMALVKPTLRHHDLVLRAPGMLALHLALDRVEAPTRAKVWNDEVKAYDMGDLPAQWFSDLLGRPLRLVRFDPEQQRLADRKWTGEIAAEAAFADAFPLLVASTASIDDFNRHLAQPVGIERFRPNLVLDGLQPWDEDSIDTLRITTDEGPVVLKLVKPCTRCSMPDVDPATAEAGHAVGDALQQHRRDPRMNGAVTFGMNAVIVEGNERMLRTGQQAEATFSF